MNAAAILTVLLAQASSSAQSVPAPLDAKAPVTFRGVGPVRVGMSLSDLRRVLRVPVTVEPELTKGCTYAYPTAEPHGITFMISGGTVARTDVEGQGFRTLSGAQVGDSESRIFSLYPGRVVRTPHAYSNGYYLTVTSSDGRFVLVFETDGNTVTAYHVGRLPEALYVEGCS